MLKYGNFIPSFDIDIRRHAKLQAWKKITVHPLSEMSVWLYIKIKIKNFLKRID